jgi:succinyl-CoA synthetase beta subunit
MNIHEYQSKEIFRAAGVKVPRGIPAFDVEGAVSAARELGGSIWVVKAQIHAGGRGKAGGVKLARSLDEVRQHAAEILGKTLVTHQTGPEGQLVRRLYIEEGVNIARELYLGAVIDRATSRITLMASTEGGVEIEKVAEETPEKILKAVVDPAVGLQEFQSRQLAFGLGLEGKQVGAFGRFAASLYEVFVARDCALAEINPLVVTGAGEVIALDAKVNFDDNALFRHKERDGVPRPSTKRTRQEIAAEEVRPLVRQARRQHRLHGQRRGPGDGDDGHHPVQGRRARELPGRGRRRQQGEGDGGVPDHHRDPAVKGILVNIFGGIMKCDVIAEGVIAAVKEVGLQVPLVVRLEGTNAELGKKILAESGLNVIPRTTWPTRRARSWPPSTADSP